MLKISKTVIAGLLAVSLSLMGGASFAAAPKAGASCPKLGVTKVEGQVSFKCVKGNRKLEWNKGTTLMSLDNLNTALVRKRAYAEFHRALTSAPQFETKITFILGPAASKAKANAELVSLKRAIRLWGDIFKPSEVFAVYVAEGDEGWVDAALCNQANYCTEKFGRWSDQIRQGVKNGACTSGQSILSDGNLPINIQCIGSQSEGLQNRQTTPHEYQHSVQRIASDIDGYPRWFVEGSAVFFGAYTALYTGAKYPEDLDYLMHFDANAFTQRQTICDVNPVTAAKIASCFPMSDLRSGSFPREKIMMLSDISYYPGALATEVLVALYGIPKIKTFMTEMKTQNFDTAFESVFKISANTFYTKASVYVNNMLRQGR